MAEEYYILAEGFLSKDSPGKVVKRKITNATAHELRKSGVKITTSYTKAKKWAKDNGYKVADSRCQQNRTRQTYNDGF